VIRRNLRARQPDPGGDKTRPPASGQDEVVTLDPKQLARLVESVASAASARVALGRASFSPAEIAMRNGVSARFVYREIKAGRLAVARPGAGTLSRITVEAERLWLHGQVQRGDEPAFGIAPTATARAYQRALGKGSCRG
jgi:hypothetical protein